MGPGQAPVDDLPDAGTRCAGGVGQARFCCAVDQLPASVLRQEPVPRRRPARAHRLGRRLLGLVRCRPRAGAEQPQDHRRIPPPQRSAGHPGLDEMRVIVTPPLNEAPVSLIDVSTYLPGEPIGADYYAQFAGSDELRENLMFRAPKFRHHVGPDETAIDMIERAADGLIERHGHDVIANIDVLITHTPGPELPFY